MNDTFQRKLFLLTLVITVFPFLLNFFGFDFGSQSVPLITQYDSNKLISNDDQFYALSGALHHALMEWSAVTLALIAGIASFFHYYRFRDISVPIIGLALLCAGFTDAFHTLAATRIISASVPNSDFIPFTWAFSRIFNACMVIAGVLLSLWLTRSSGAFNANEKKNSASNKSVVVYQDKVLIIISCSFISFAIFAVLLAATSIALPQTTFPNAFITRPYDVIPLALFIFSGSLIKKNTVIRRDIVLI